MLTLRKAFDQSFLRSIYRSYVSIININADTVKKIKIIPDEYENSYQESEIRIEAIDGDKNLIKLSDSNSKITKTKDEFHLEWLDKKEDSSIIVEVPVSSSRDIELSVKIKNKGDIKIDNLPTTKTIDIYTGDGKVLIESTRAESVTAIAKEIGAQAVYAMVMDLKGTKKDPATIYVQQCQVELFRAIGTRISVDSCYTRSVEIDASQQCLLKNLHGNARVKAAGEVFNTVGFSGTLNAEVTCHSSLLHFSQLIDNNKITIDYPEAIVRAAFSNEIVKETTDLHIESDCPIQTKSKEFVVCHKSEKEYEIIRKNPESDSSFKMDIKNAKEVNIIKQSWIDSLRFDA